MASQPDPTPPPFSVRTLAQRWECSEGVIRKMIEEGRLKPFRIGVLIRIPAAEVERFEQCQNTPSSDSAPATLSSGETRTERGTGISLPRPIGLERKQRPASAGSSAPVIRGPWER